MLAVHTNAQQERSSESGLEELGPHAYDTLTEIRARFLARGPNSLDDHDALMLMLAPVVGSDRARQIAPVLLRTFGTFANVVSARTCDLAKVYGLGNSTIAMLKLVQVAATWLARAEVLAQPTLSNLTGVIAYLRLLLARAPTVQVQGIFLDSSNAVICDENVGIGSLNSFMIHPREIVKRALELRASALITARNVTSFGIATGPSEAEMIRELRRALEIFSIRLHDHLILSRRSHLSYRQQGLL
jgi:DNA repair protein RadC